MPLKVWNGTSWNVMAQIKVWNGSAWVTSSAGKVWNGTAWVQFHPGVFLDDYPNGGGDIDLYDDDYNPSGFGSAAVSIELNSSGVASYSEGGVTVFSYNWLLTGSASDYYAYMDAPTGSAFSTGTTGSSLQLNTTRTWSLSQSGDGSKSNTSTLRIKNSSGTDIVTIPTTLYVFVSSLPPP